MKEKPLTIKNKNDMETKKENGGQQPATQQAPKSLQLQSNISEQVMKRISAFEKEGSIKLPDNYSPENHLKSAWLILQDVKDRSNNSALTVCTKESIANALLNMVLQGLSVSKSQGYFIVYGKELTFVRSYFGTVALAKRIGMTSDPVANIIYDKDNFVYKINPETGLTEIVQHEQKLENIDNAKIRGAYAIVTMPDGQKQVTIMTLAQIHAAWNQGATKGTSPAHKNFADEMAKKSVINRACKMIINSSTDAWLYEGSKDESDTDIPEEKKDATVADKAATKDVNIEDVKFEDVPTEEQGDIQQTVPARAEQKEETKTEPVPDPY